MAKPELLAPAGDLASLAAAVDSGADAVYFGLKGFSARRSFAEFSFENAQAAREFTKSRGVKIYPALNSMLRGRELGGAASALDFLNHLGADGLIVQDLGAYYLARRLFPGIPLHSSTLMAAHSSAAVRALKEMGFSRVVLAREMSLKEVSQAAKIKGVEVELFVHGALCFSISGLCLASSYWGGRSGLRGLCTQPCRRLFKSGKKRGRFLSAADLSLIEHIREIGESGAASIKIEGRMKRPDYVAGVVAAYRSVLDAKKDELPERVAAARDLLNSLAGRRLSTGHLLPEKRPPVLIPHHSGASGRLVGRVAAVKKGRAVIKVREPFARGDVLRPEGKETAERRTFAVKEIAAGKKRIGEARAGSSVHIRPERGLSLGTNLFLVSRAKEGRRWRAQAKKLIKVKKSGHKPSRTHDIFGGCPKRESPGEERCYIKVARVELLAEALALPAQAVFLCGGAGELRSLAAKPKLIKKHRARLGVGLPPVVFEDGLEGIYAAVRELSGMGVRRFLVSNVAHLDVFAGLPGLFMGDFSLNVLNSAGLCAAMGLGMEAQVLSLEADMGAIREALAPGRGAEPVVAIYARPRLMVSRFDPFSGKRADLTGPKGERLVAERGRGLTIFYEKRPLCLLGHLKELRDLGVRSFLIDLSSERGAGGRVRELFKGYKKMRPPGVHSTFNLMGRLE